MTTPEERFAIRLMVAQGVLFSIEVAIIHYLGPALSIPLFGCLRGLGGVLMSMAFARQFNVFCTEQLPLQLLRGTIVLAYGWVLVYSFGRLPLADATAISYTIIVYIAVLSILILGEMIPPRRWLAIGMGVVGALFIAKPSFTGIGLVYLVALIGTSLNALTYVLNRYSNRKDSPETTMAWTNIAAFAGNLPLCCILTPLPDSWTLPWLASFLVLGPLGVYAGVVAAKYAEASILGPYQLLRLIFGVLGGCLAFLEIPDLPTSIGIGFIGLSFVLNLNPPKRTAVQTVAVRP
jgi:drug/metabolite transporter (DMT)-like permease